MALLREWGIIEGYPAGGFRGDRAISRWEAAMMIARALARLESQQALLASKADREALARLVAALRPELEGLGVRVANLEENVSRLDQRVNELSRISFTGQLQAAVVSQGFRNTGNSRGGLGPASLDYNLTGTTAMANLVPHGATGIIPALDLVRGRPLTNGVGYSSALLLNVEARPNDDLSAEMRLYAYTSQGDGVINALWGVQPPYLANSFTGTNFLNGQNINHVPFTNAGVDRLRVTHYPSNLTFTLGSFLPRFISPQVYLGEVNPRVGDPRVLDSFGFHLSGDHEPFGWEVFGTRLPDGNPGFGTNPRPYSTDAVGAALTYNEGPWTAGLSFLRAANQALDTGLLTMGMTNLVQGVAGEVNLNWVNPAGFYVNQLGGPTSSLVAGTGSTSDGRPIPGFAASDAFGRGGNFGPQGITLGGFNVNYAPEGEGWNVAAECNYSDYRPNKNSRYNTTGSLWRVGGGATVFDDQLSFRLDYRWTDPRYDPMILAFPGTAAGLNPFRSYHRFPDHDQFWHLYSLHNTDQFPQNRRGIWFETKWQYDPDAFLQFKYRNLEQVETSLQDVRVKAGSLGPGTPQVNVLGFSPGFFDVVFREFSPLSFDANLNPLENKRGRVQSFGLAWSHIFTDTPWRLDASFDYWRFRRPTGLPANLGGSQNNVDLTNYVGRLGVGYKAFDNVLLTVGYEVGAMYGHYDPGGFYNPFAIATGSTSFTNRDGLQHIPFWEVNWDVSEGIRCGADFHYYDSVDNVNPRVFPGLPGGATAFAHPYSFDGYRLGTRLEVNF